MSALGHKRTWSSEFGMSASPPKDGVIGRKDQRNGGCAVIEVKKLSKERQC